jgi:peptide chain release factor 2
LRWQQYLEDIGSAIELLQVKSDADLMAEAQVYCDRLTHELNQWEIQQLLCQPYDTRNVRLSIKVQTETVEDWGWILLQMYFRWAMRQNYTVTVIDQCGRDFLQSITLEISGNYAYGYLKMEDGVHSLRKMPSIPIKNRTKLLNHQAFVQVTPLMDDQISIAIPPEHWEVMTLYPKSNGNVNGGDYRVQITHIPTGLTVCINEGFPWKNQEKAIVVLTNQLFWIMKKYHLQDLSEIRSTMLEIDWHHPIRQYRFEPKPLIEDNRTGYTSTKIHEILAGEIDDLLESGIRGGFNDRTQANNIDRP